MVLASMVLMYVVTGIVIYLVINLNSRIKDMKKFLFNLSDRHQGVYEKVKEQRDRVTGIDGQVNRNYEESKLIWKFTRGLLEHLGLECEIYPERTYEFWKKKKVKK